jgi:hypothetical protein
MLVKAIEYKGTENDLSKNHLSKIQCIKRLDNRVIEFILEKYANKFTEYYGVNFNHLKLHLNNIFFTKTLLENNAFSNLYYSKSL